jgi:hypothetical protein
MTARKKKTAKKRVAPKGKRKQEPAAGAASAAKGETDIRRTAIHWALGRMR